MLVGVGRCWVRRTQDANIRTGASSNVGLDLEKRLFLIGCVFALGIVCIYYYSLVIESVSPRSVKVPLGVGLEAAPGRLFRHTLYQ